MNYDLTGVLHKKLDIESKSPSFQTREFVVTTQDGNFQQYIKFQLTQDRCSVIDNVAEGETVKVNFDLRGREWQGKYFTNLNAWRVEKVGAESNNQDYKSGSVPPPPVPPIFNENDDDLPF
ncbi:MAG: DUF3127 domain-containing protein [Saprospiraceae bacterium]